MTKVVDLNEYRIKALEQRGFGPWQKRFGEPFDSKTRLADLSNKTLYFLSQPGEPSSVAYYEFIMGVLDLGVAPKFHYLANKDQMKVVEVHLFLADQMRFEMMRRLGWLKKFAGERLSLIEMVSEFDRTRAKCTETPPELVESNPDYAAYVRLNDRDKEVFIRRMLQKALEAFKKRL